MDFISWWILTGSVVVMMANSLIISSLYFKAKMKMASSGSQEPFLGPSIFELLLSVLIWPLFLLALWLAVYTDEKW